MTAPNPVQLGTYLTEAGFPSEEDTHTYRYDAAVSLIALWNAHNKDRRIVRDLPLWVDATTHLLRDAAPGSLPGGLIARYRAWYAVLGELAPWYAATGLSLTQAHHAHTDPDPTIRDQVALLHALG